MKFIKATSVHKLVAGANEMKIQKEDIVNILQLPNCYVLIYFG